MKIDEYLNNPLRMKQLDELVVKHTDFNNFKDMIDVVHNFRLSLKIDDDMNNIQRREIKMLADLYDEYMIMNNDPRRIYRLN